MSWWWPHLRSRAHSPCTPVCTDLRVLTHHSGYDIAALQSVHRSLQYEYWTLSRDSWHMWHQYTWHLWSLTQPAESAGHHHVPGVLGPQGQRVDEDEAADLDHGLWLVTSWSTGLWLVTQTCHGPLVGLAQSPEAALQTRPDPWPEAERCHNPERVKWNLIVGR